MKTYVLILDCVYKVSTGRIILNKQRDKFAISKGVRLGDTTSTKVFAVCLEYILKKLDPMYGYFCIFLKAFKFEFASNECEARPITQLSCAQ